MKTQAITYAQSQAFREEFSSRTVDAMSEFLLVLSLISLVSFTAFSISPSVEVISIDAITIGVLSALIIILPILISGIINLILIIS